MNQSNMTHPPPFVPQQIPELTLQYWTDIDSVCTLGADHHPNLGIGKFRTWRNITLMKGRKLHSQVVYWSWKIL